MTAEELRNSILSAPKNGYSKLTAEQRKEMEAYALRYRAFMDACKTEREATAWATAMAEKHGFVPVGERKDYYELPREDALLMTKFFK